MSGLTKGMHALQSRPIAKPEQLLSRNTLLSAEGFENEHLNAFSRLGRQIASLLVILKQELCPHYKMLDVCLQPVRPVVVQYPVVRGVTEREVARGRGILPMQALVLHESQHRTVCPL